MAIPSKYNVPVYPRTVAGKLVHSHEEEQAALREEYLQKKAALEAHPHHNILEKIGLGIEKGAEVVGETAAAVALTGLGAFKDE